MNYRVRQVDTRGKGKVIHINASKAYNDRSTPVRRLTVLADEPIPEQNIEVQEALGRCQGDIDKVLGMFPGILSDTPGNSNIVEVSLTVKEGCVVSLPPYKVPERLRDGVKREVEKLLKEGIIEESTSYWSSPVVPVLKPSGDIRLCVDFRKLNDITVQEHCYIPDLEDILSKVSDSMVLSKLDLTQGFHQIRVEPQSKNLTTFVCPYGRYRFNRMLFGLKNAPATFQRAMEKVLHPCSGFAACYIDDVVVFSKTWDERLGHLTSVLQALDGLG